MNAAELGWIATLDMLIEKRAEVNASDASGKTVLMYAMGNRNLSTVAALVSRGARVNERDAQGRTPLMYAITNARHDPIRIYGHPNDPAEETARYVELVKFLVDHNADVNAADKAGLTPLAAASQLHRPEIADLLRRAGAK